MGHFSKIVIFLLIKSCNSVIAQLTINDRFTDTMDLKREGIIHFGITVLQEK
jgi:hypothetical protein